MRGCECWKDDLKATTALRKTHVEEADANAGSAVLVVGFDMWGDMAVIVRSDCVLSVHGTCQECHWRVPAVVGLTCVDRESRLNRYKMVIIRM
jgi:hypothetical protein